MTLCHDQVIRWTEVKVHVCSERILCLGRSHSSEVNAKWMEQIQFFQQSKECAELSGIDGEPIEFEWNIFTRFASFGILRHN